MNCVDKIIFLLKEKNLEQKDLCDALGIYPAAVTTWKKGTTKSYLKYLPQIAEYLETTVDYLLNDEDEASNISPVGNLVFFEEIGMVKAGYEGECVEEHTGEKVPMPDYLLHGKPKDDFFLLRVRGSSMYPTFYENDLVLCERASSVDSGAYAVVMYDEEFATVKKVVYEQGEDWLELVPDNKNFKTKRIEGADLEECRVLGKVVYATREFH